MKATLEKLSGIKYAGRAFRYRNFRLFISGQSISLVGTWMQRLAASWLVYRLTDSAMLLGIVSFAGMLPTGFIAPFAGVIADRFDKRLIVIVTQFALMAEALILAFLVLTDLVHVWHVVVLSIIQGIINGFDMPTRQSFMVHMVDDKKDLGNAIALNSTVVNGARLLGPTMAGLLIAVLGEGLCFLINSVSYGAVIISLLLMKVPKTPSLSKQTNVWKNLKEGYLYVRGFEPILAILLLYSVVNLLASPYGMLMPIFAKDILKGGPDTMGFLAGMSGGGALFGALFLAFRKSVRGLMGVITVAVGVFSIGLLLFAFSENLPLSLAFMFIVGWGQMVLMAGGNTLLQTLVDDDKRGRVMSFYTLGFMGFQPLGSLVAGLMASRIGAPWTMFIGGSVCLFSLLLFIRRLPRIREAIRPIYIQLGILPKST